jgi:hypothetical protein
MKKILILFAALVTITLGSCTIDASDNGDLDGNWQLMRVDTIGGGSKDTKNWQIFYAVQFRLLSVSAYSYPVGNGGFMFHFDHTADSLKLSTAAADGSNMYDLKTIEPFGLTSLNEHFKVQLLNSDNMVLESKKLRLTFRKF